MVPPFHPEHPGYSLPDMRPEESLKNQYKKKNLYLFHIPSLYLKTPVFIPEHRKSVFQIILDNFCLPVTIPVNKGYKVIKFTNIDYIFKVWL